GSFENYRHNFGHFVFDKDNPFWNWGIHPYSGSQIYLFYRANGYSRLQALKMSFFQDMLFECLIEIYTEPPSIQDIYQTAVLGSILGYGLEHLSMYLINSGSFTGKVVGHILNPSTLFWFYEGKVEIYPSLLPTRALNDRKSNRYSDDTFTSHTNHNRSDGWAPALFVRMRL
ncbi:MAG: DUF3943 domain-containing protein, partial [Oligoflexia bacterium]|nr:DUF3943 domain-containing protein [Oligoflexia bacterium]